MKTELTKAEEKPELSEAEKQFNIAEDERFEELVKNSKTKISQIACRNLRKAAKSMRAANAPISNTTIANFIKNIDNSDLFESTNAGKTPPKYQSISNSDKFKKYIGFYISDQEEKQAINNKKNTQPGVKSTPDFPIDSLDHKTKIYVRMLQMKVESLENERKNITSQLEAMSKKQPVSLSLSHKSAIEKGLPGLEVMSEKSPSDILLKEVLLTISTLPINFSEYFQEESRGEKTVLKVVSNSRKQMLFKSDQWKFIKDTLAGDSNE